MWARRTPPSSSTTRRAPSATWLARCARLACLFFCIVISSHPADVTLLCACVQLRNGVMQGMVGTNQAMKRE
jgi:hypothetical protein